MGRDSCNQMCLRAVDAGAGRGGACVVSEAYSADLPGNCNTNRTMERTPLAVSVLSPPHTTTRIKFSVSEQRPDHSSPDC